MASSTASEADALNPGAPLFIYALRQVTEAAALAACKWIGRGDKNRGDAAAVDAMRTALDRLPFSGTVVIGEGEKDEAPQLAKGLHVGGLSDGPQYDIAVDPVEGTTFLANGQTNAMAVLALAPRGAMFDPGPAFYMEKFAAPAAARGAIEPDWPTARKLRTLSDILGKPVGKLTVFVLEKPRHRRLVEEIHAAGARVALYPAGDVAGAIVAASPDPSIDALMGTGGTPEGIITACAIRALGGAFMGRLDPQLPSEQIAVRDAGLDTRTWLPLEQLVQSSDVLFCATGITTGLLFDGVEKTDNLSRTQTLMISGLTGERQLLTTTRPYAAEATEEAPHA
ncbi:class II fructose-bisphosphatase [Marinivivus vitaminiproducens]|uniref:class II fructose-bisphosphatase n=1 Tax=Marinivivus vitaminiproducens TaxID=3035935 RepID=UPI0027A00A76|nr:class II fructose-bisphosphatase [Geminicoccaceae bacterium SCSIO 64248]